MAAVPRFVGRKTELQQLRTALDDAGSDGGAIVLVTGEMGIGKTRLVEEFATSALVHGATVAKGRWYESTELPAFIGFRECFLELVENQVIRSAIDSANPSVQEITRLGAEFAPALGIEARTPSERSDDDQYHLWRGVSILLETAAKAAAPLLIVLDDLQWADDGSLALLNYLAREIAKSPILIVASFRDGDPSADSQLKSLMGALVQDRTMRRCVLSGLTRLEVAAVAESVAERPVAADFVETLYGQTRGNPLYVGEVVRHLKAKKALRPRRGSGASATEFEIEVPAALEELMARRCLGLSDECRRLLASASVLGREFSFSLIERMTDMTRTELLKTIDEAVEAITIVEAAAGEFSFAHPLLRSVVFRSLSTSERMTAHLKAAAALDSESGVDPGLRAREIAGHLLAAGGLANVSQVIRYCLIGARQARELFAFTEAATLIRGGLGAVSKLSDEDPDARGQLLMELGYAETALGNPSEALQVYEDALALFEQRGDTEQATDARRRLAATLAHYGRWAEVLSVTRAGLQNTEEAKSYPYVGLLGNHAMALMVSGDSVEAGRSVEQLLRLGFDDRTRAVANHAAACWYSWGAGGDGNQALRHFESARQMFLNERLDATASQISLDLAVVRWVLGKFDEIEEPEQQAEKLAGATGKMSVLADLHSFRSLVATQRGDWELARRERDRCRTIVSDVGGNTIYSQFAERGEALELFWRSGPLAAQTCLNGSVPISNEPLLAVLTADRADSTQAAQLIDQIRGAVPAGGRGLFWLAVALPAASALAGLDAAGELPWKSGLERYRGCLVDWCMTDIELGRIAAQAERWDEANALFIDAAETCRTYDFKPFLALACYYRGLMYLRRRGRGHGRRALGLLEEADGLFCELELDYMRQKVQVLLTQPRRGRPPTNGPHGLTEREASVVALLAQGKTNREIAAQLFVADRTVARHLEHVYTKLGVNSRGAAIAWAVRQGIASGSASSR